MKSQPWRRVKNAWKPRVFAASSFWKTMKSGSMSGSLPAVFGFAVVARVLVHPPRVADADEQVGEQAAGEVVGLAGVEHLPVGGLVGEERVLGEDDAEHGGDDEHEPGVLQERKGDPGAGHRGGDADEGQDVERATAVQQPGLAHGAQQCRELGDRIGDTAGAGLDDAAV